MKIGICSANSGPYSTRRMLDSLADLADLAEEAGVESVWVSEHPVLADHTSRHRRWIPMTRSWTR